MYTGCGDKMVSRLTQTRTHCSRSALQSIDAKGVWISSVFSDKLFREMDYRGHTHLEIRVSLTPSYIFCSHPHDLVGLSETEVKRSLSKLFLKPLLTPSVWNSASSSLQQQSQSWFIVAWLQQAMESWVWGCGPQALESLLTSSSGVLTETDRSFFLNESQQSETQFDYENVTRQKCKSCVHNLFWIKSLPVSFSFAGEG